MGIYEALDSRLGGGIAKVSMFHVLPDWTVNPPDGVSISCSASSHVLRGTDEHIEVLSQ